MYSIVIESEQFKGVRTPKQHQMVTAVIEVSRSTTPLPRFVCVCVYQQATTTKHRH
jgi:hypothetical protein